MLITTTKTIYLPNGDTGPAGVGLGEVNEQMKISTILKFRLHVGYAFKNWKK